MNPSKAAREGLNGSVTAERAVAAPEGVRAAIGPQVGAQGPGNLNSALHARRAHPDWEYATTEGPRKRWDDADTPPLDDDGEPDHTWQRNTDAGRDGWERFDYTEESYWRRPRKTTEPQEDETPLQAAHASIDLRDAVVAQLKLRADLAEAKARELEGATDVALRAVQLMQTAGAERDTAQRLAVTFQTRIDAARDWARRNLPADQRDALLRVLRGDTTSH